MLAVLLAYAEISHKAFILAIVGVLSASFAWAQDEAVIRLSDTVTGNQEQPKVLYIVPWQRAEDDTILYQPVKTMLNQDVFGHIERPEHLREVEYLEELSGSADQF